MDWLFTDEEGNVVHEETLVDNNFVSSFLAPLLGLGRLAVQLGLMPASHRTLELLLRDSLPRHGSWFPS